MHSTVMRPVAQRKPRRGSDFVLPDVPMLESPVWSDTDDASTERSASDPAEPSAQLSSRNQQIGGVMIVPPAQIGYQGAGFVPQRTSTTPPTVIVHGVGYVSLGGDGRVGPLPTRPPAVFVPNGSYDRPRPEWHIAAQENNGARGRYFAEASGANAPRRVIPSPAAQQRQARNIDVRQASSPPRPSVKEATEQTSPSPEQCDATVFPATSPPRSALFTGGSLFISRHRDHEEAEDGEEEGDGEEANDRQSDGSGGSAFSRSSSSGSSTSSNDRTDGRGRRRPRAVGSIIAPSYGGFTRITATQQMQQQRKPSQFAMSSITNAAAARREEAHPHHFTSAAAMVEDNFSVAPSIFRHSQLSSREEVEGDSEEEGEEEEGELMKGSTVFVGIPESTRRHGSVTPTGYTFDHPPASTSADPTEHAMGSRHGTFLLASEGSHGRTQGCGPLRSPVHDMALSALQRPVTERASVPPSLAPGSDEDSDTDGFEQTQRFRFFQSVNSRVLMQHGGGDSEASRSQYFISGTSLSNDDDAAMAQEYSEWSVAGSGTRELPYTRRTSVNPPTSSTASPERGNFRSRIATRQTSLPHTPAVQPLARFPAMSTTPVPTVSSARGTGAGTPGARGSTQSSRRPQGGSEPIIFAPEATMLTNNGAAASREGESGSGTAAATKSSSALSSTTTLKAGTYDGDEYGLLCWAASPMSVRRSSEEHRGLAGYGGAPSTLTPPLPPPGASKTITVPAGTLIGRRRSSDLDAAPHGMVTVHAPAVHSYGGFDGTGSLVEAGLISPIICSTGVSAPAAGRASPVGQTVRSSARSPAPAVPANSTAALTTSIVTRGRGRVGPIWQSPDDGLFPFGEPFSMIRGGGGSAGTGHAGASQRASMTLQQSFFSYYGSADYPLQSGIRNGTSPRGRATTSPSEMVAMPSLLGPSNARASLSTATSVLEDPTGRGTGPRAAVFVPPPPTQKRLSGGDAAIDAKDSGSAPIAVVLCRPPPLPRERRSSTTFPDLPSSTYPSPGRSPTSTAALRGLEDYGFTFDLDHSQVAEPQRLQPLLADPVSHLSIPYAPSFAPQCSQLDASAGRGEGGRPRAVTVTTEELRARVNVSPAALDTDARHRTLSLPSPNPIKAKPSINTGNNNSNSVKRASGAGWSSLAPVSLPKSTKSNWSDRRRAEERLPSSPETVVASLHSTEHTPYVDLPSSPRSDAGARGMDSTSRITPSTKKLTI